MIVRQHERVDFQTTCTLHLADGGEVVCHTLDVSLGGMKVGNQSPHSLLLLIGSLCLVEFPLPSFGEGAGEGTLLKTKALIVNGDLRGVGLAFQGLDQETLLLLKKLVGRSLQEEDLQTLSNKPGVAIQGPHVKFLKSQLQEHIIEAVKEIFIAFLAIDVIPGPYMERPDFDEYIPPETDVTGVIHFHGALEGGVHLATPLHFAINAAGALLGEAGLEFDTQQDDMVWDAFGEITNQVAGSIQTRLSSQFNEINMTAPNVVVGPNMRIKYRSTFSSVRQFFRSSFGPFFVECFFS
ncbi:MAG: chemotaxis protein CheX [Magnetococcus sp. MYC-9]